MVEFVRYYRDNYVDDEGQLTDAWVLAEVTFGVENPCFNPDDLSLFAKVDESEKFFGSFSGDDRVDMINPDGEVIPVLKYDVRRYYRTEVRSLKFGSHGILVNAINQGFGLDKARFDEILLKWEKDCRYEED